MKKIEKSFIAGAEISPLSIFYVTINDFSKAQALAKLLVEKKLVACTNIVGNTENPITSIYRWEGKIEEDKEFLMIMKSRTQLLREIVDEVKKNHSYTVPEVIACPILGGNVDYLNWVFESTKEPEVEEVKE